MLEGAIIRPYKAGSIIYFEGDRGEGIYVLQQGRVHLISSSIDGKEEFRENVKKGEFFGVKSSMGHFPREETAQVLVDSSILIFSLKAFEQLCIKNIRLVLQVLKVFSSQLRKIHKQVRKQLGESETLEHSVEFLKVGEYYFKNGQIDEANCALEKFMEHYQDSPVYDRAVKLKQALNAGESYPEQLESLSHVPKNITADPGNTEVGGGATTMDDGVFASAYGTVSSKASASAIFYEGLNLVSQEDTDAAIERFKEIFKLKNFANPKEAEFLEKAYLEISKCYLKKGDTKGTISNATEFMKRYPKSNSVKTALLLLGQAFENDNNRERAITFYSKVMSLPPKDKDSNTAASKLEKLQEK